MKNYILLFIASLIFATTFTACKSGRAISKAIAPRDTTLAVIKTTNTTDSLEQIKVAINNLMEHKIVYKTFNAKIKLDIQSSKENTPDLLANVKIIKDSVIWISISATMFNYEVFRVYITKDSVTLLDKREKTVQYRSIDYLKDITNIPFDFATIQDLIIGNPIFFNDKNLTVKKFEKYSLISTVDKGFKNLITLTTPENLLEHCKLDDTDLTQNRTADFTFADYENGSGFPFSTKREVVATEKNKLEIKMNYKQYEFNKELSINFSVPKSYKKK